MLKSDKECLKPLIIIMIITMTIIGFIVVWYTRGIWFSKFVGPVEYAEDLLSMELEDAVEPYGIRYHLSGGILEEEFFGCIYKSKIPLDDLLDLFEDAGYTNHIENMILVSGDSSELFRMMSEMIRSQHVDGYFIKFLEGKKAKTRDVNIYVTDDDKGDVYMYIIG